MIKIKIYMVASLFLFLSAMPYAFSEPAAPKEGDYYDVYRLIDGDTLVLRNEERVRLLGVDAPEMINSPKLHRDARQLGVSSASIKAVGLQSKRFLAGLIEGKKARFEYDGLKRDRNGRLLAYVYLENGTFVNAQVLLAGHAALLEKSKTTGMKYYDRFYQMQNEAITQERGIWKFMNQRVNQLYEDPYSSLSETQRKAVLEYVEQLRSGQARESYTPVKISSNFKTAAESSPQKAHLAKTQPA